ncbi:methyltransferase domain-containing protein [Amycolatopsis sp. 195334CR]|uniref:methyltransferase domain-containing protein n=1 Tax=Amycolatopsis sp. 195334CR TaxID=2814588 RepID=UPI001A8E7F76|nr:methyltransferase domain-containing protein [Amycolatopsis sp. 195334CR]MBN6039978.1 methyltransferase domain-containing protein [Amycolatopsis sp. 195334CR]
MRAELVATGKLHSPAVQQAIVSTPRHVFVPRFYVRSRQGWIPVQCGDAATHQRWRTSIYRNHSLVTQLGDVAVGSRDTTGPTSSSSAPGLMTRMIEQLDVRRGHRVLEIGTGTGWNAALLSRLVGDDNVSSIDVDHDLVDTARRHLNQLDLHPRLVTGDGFEGLPAHAPYDRFMATCATSWVPAAWVEQLAPRGRLLVDLKIHAAAGNLVLLTRDGDQTRGRFDTGAATFMHMRSPAFDQPWHGYTPRDRASATHSRTTSRAERLWENPVLWFLIHLHEPGRLNFGYCQDPDTGGPGDVYFTSPDGSWCELSNATTATREVREGGPRRLWAQLDDITTHWHSLGSPGWDRLGLTITDGNQFVWLDHPHSDVTWALPRTSTLQRPATAAMSASDRRSA